MFEVSNIIVHFSYILFYYMIYRYDINGLRAIAVIAVVLFHFNPQWLPGGFAGVDVFFVISGFLMTSIIFNGVEKNTFNLFKFYTARANRIIPVLAVMSAVLLIFGWFFLLPTDFQSLGKQVEKSSLFISNILFSRGGSYFDTAEHTKWLLHTWSLSVEWQFYILFPIIIITLKNYLSFTNLKRVVIGLFLASFIYCIYATNKDSKTAYFLLNSRAWEMLLGGLAFIYPWSFKNKQLQMSTQLLGLILIVASYFLISKDTLWPGYMALIPVFGAYLIIVSNYQNSGLINNNFFKYIGRWSYSIYVWHWPLVVLGFYLAFTNWWMFGIPLSILLGFISYQFIEKVNYPRYTSWKKIYKVKPFYFFLIILGCGYAVKKTDGMKFHYSQDIIHATSENNNSNPYKCDSNLRNRDVEECVVGNKNNIKAVVIGDSHADALTTAVAEVFNLENDGVISIVTASCPLILDANIKDSANKDDCYNINTKRIKLILSEKYKNIPVILISRLPVYLEGQNEKNRMDIHNIRPTIYFNGNVSTDKNILYKLTAENMTKTLCLISKNNPTYITQPVPELPFNVPETVAKNLLLKKNEQVTYSYSDYLNRSKKVRDLINRSAKLCGVQIIDPTEILCDTKNLCMVSYKGRPIYRDGDHLSEYGNKLLTPLFKNALLQ